MVFDNLRLISKKTRLTTIFSDRNIMCHRLVKTDNNRQNMKYLYSLLLLILPLSILAQSPTTYSSGFAVSKNHLVTSFHTVKGFDGVLVTGINGDMSQGYIAKVVATDAPNDIALLKITDGNFSGFSQLPYSFKKTDDVVGAATTAIGYGKLSENNKVSSIEGKISVNSGISGSADHFQTTMSTASYNAGAPIVNNAGDVIGMVVSYVYNNKNINFATKSKAITKLLISKQIVLPQGTGLKGLKGNQRIAKMQSATCMVMCFKGGVGTVSDFIAAKTSKIAKSNIVNGHECVDLGLSVRWATCNIGASAPEDFGQFFSWGETKTKKNFTPGDYTYKREIANSWINIGDDIKDTKYDVAKIIWGNDWRLPTAVEVRELLDKCEWQWIEENDKSGYRITGPNGNSIFLPAAGVKMLDETYYENSYGYYWTSNISPSDAGNAYNLYFFSSYKGVDSVRRYFGHVVRGVTE